MSLPQFVKKQLMLTTTRYSKRVTTLVIGAGLFLMTGLLLKPLSSWQGDVPDDFGWITRVDISSVTESRLASPQESSISVHLKNSSKSKAIGISISFAGDFSNQNIPGEKRVISLASLGPGEDQSLPVMPVSDFLLGFRSQCPGCFFLGVGKEAAMPIDITARLCKSKLDKRQSCRLEYSYYPFEIRKKFTTVYGDEINGGNTLFAFLSRSEKTDLVVPKNN